MIDLGKLELSSCVLVLLAAILCYYLSDWFRAVLVVSRLPGPPGVPLLGHSLLLTDHKRLLQIGANAYQEYGSLIKIWLTVLPSVLVVAPEFIQPVLCSFKHTDKIHFYKFLHNFLGEGLITSSGEKWRTHRKLIQPAFSQGVLESFLESFHKSSQRLARRFKDKDGPVNITSYINEAVLDILNDVVLGVTAEEEEHKDGDSPFRKMDECLMPMTTGSNRDTSHDLSGVVPQEPGAPRQPPTTLAPWGGPVIGELSGVTDKVHTRPTALRGHVVAPYRMTRPWLMLGWIYKWTESAKKELTHKDNLHTFIRETPSERYRVLNRGTWFIREVQGSSERYRIHQRGTGVIREVQGPSERYRFNQRGTGFIIEVQCSSKIQRGTGPIKEVQGSYESAWFIMQARGSYYANWTVSLLILSLPGSVPCNSSERPVVFKRRKEINKKPFESEQIGTKDLSQSWRPLVDRIVEIADQSNKFNDEDIIQEVCTFMLAGQESVATAVTFTLFLLAKHPDVLSRVLDEVDAVLGELPNVPTLGALRKMCYTEQCIKEALRLYPSVPIIARTLSEDVPMGKVTLPKGCQVIITPYATHRIPHIYPNPEKFDPDRFLPENMRGRHPYAYIPFSAGPRICIGYKFAMLEMKMLLGEILRKYHVTTVPGKEELCIKYRITIRASGGVWLQFAPRAAQVL
uniref:Cytochrome P450 n=1 Tax=Timema douglasi TaxID=61478 RepID=A0A7R8ZC15_TIMDO|nr:unnamed protein product [Timema douglasi]